MSRLLTIIFAGLYFAPIALAAETPGVKVDWLDHAVPMTQTGVSFGVPWPRGGIQKRESLRLVDANGQSIPVQTWPLAYWPDGSLKWTGHAMAANARRGARIRSHRDVRATRGRRRRGTRRWFMTTCGRDIARRFHKGCSSKATSTMSQS